MYHCVVTVPHYKLYLLFVLCSKYFSYTHDIVQLNSYYNNTSLQIESTHHLMITHMTIATNKNSGQNNFILKKFKFDSQ